MRTTIKKALGAAGLVAMVLLAIGYALPDTIAVTRSTVVRAEPREIHALISSLRTWPEWTVWNTDTDPSVQFVFEGAERGVGARWKWKGEVFQEGELEIVESDPDRGVFYRVTMASGLSFEGSLAFSRAEGGTLVTWTDEADLGLGPIGGFAALLFRSGVDEEVGRNQEVGLRELAARVIHVESS